jgi:hypothetical protein
MPALVLEVRHEVLADRVPQALFHPLAQPAPARHPGAVAEVRRKVGPRHPGLQDDEDSAEHEPIVDASPPTSRTGVI